MKKIIVTIFFLFLSIPMPSKSVAETFKDSDIFTFSLENDAFGQSDKYYTSGVELTWLSDVQKESGEKTAIPAKSISLLKALPFFAKPESPNLFSISLGQKIFTPEDLGTTKLIKDDRPYTGIAYLSIGFYNKGKMGMDSLKIDVGIAGPTSYAEQSQQTVHDLFGFRMPKGWENQIKDEPILNFVYDRRDIKSCKKNEDHFGYDFISRAGFALGNAYTYVNAGVKFRFGWHLQEDFGMPIFYPQIKNDVPIQCLGLNFYVSLDERFVLQDISLDGNTFRHSHSVEKSPFVANFQAGIELTGTCFKVGYTHNYHTKEFELQKGGHDFGMIYLSLFF
ncbi:MAG: lipid A deacylase LpxR family protein [Deltaproteobacteria bacterium]|nr:lipid A deacylase LpxR family protein [Deltaproteobacteria bacterium]